LQTDRCMLAALVNSCMPLRVPLVSIQVTLPLLDEAAADKRH
jgi:hypothetical protein